MGETILDRVERIPCHPGNRGGSRPAGEIRYLVYHYTGNDGDRAAANGRYYRDNLVLSSAHYFVDDGAVVQSVEDGQVAWAVGGKKWSDCPRTGGGGLYGVVNNRNSISIEMCGTAGDGTRRASSATLALASALGRALMEKYHIPAENVVRHFDVTGKHCPAYFMDGESWAAFKAGLTEKEEREMEIFHYVSEMPDWARESAARAIDLGVIKMDGTGAVNVYEANLQPLVWLDRLGLLGKEG